MTQISNQKSLSTTLVEVKFDWNNTTIYQAAKQKADEFKDYADAVTNPFSTSGLNFLQGFLEGKEIPDPVKIIEGSFSNPETLKETAAKTLRTGRVALNKKAIFSKILVTQGAKVNETTKLFALKSDGDTKDAGYLTAGISGVVKDICIKVGDEVQENEVVVIIETDMRLGAAIAVENSLKLLLAHKAIQNNEKYLSEIIQITLQKYERDEQTNQIVMQKLVTKGISLLNITPELIRETMLDLPNIQTEVLSGAVQQAIDNQENFSEITVSSRKEIFSNLLQYILTMQSNLPQSLANRQGILTVIADNLGLSSETTAEFLKQAGIIAEAQEAMRDLIRNDS